MAYDLIYFIVNRWAPRPTVHFVDTIYTSCSKGMFEPRLLYMKRIKHQSISIQSKKKQFSSHIMYAVSCASKYSS